MIKTDRIISLGYNCEISFRLEDYFGKLDSYLFSWSYECDRNLFINAISDIEGVFSDDISLMDDHMFKCNKYNIKFHPRYDILPKFGEITDIQIEDGRKELTDRLAHLKHKMRNMYNDEQHKIFFLKVEDKGTEDNIAFIKGVYSELEKNIPDKFALVAILEKHTVNDEIKNLESDSLKIRTLKKFANIKHTDIFGDINGWKYIISEFALSDGKCYRKNLFKRRKEIIPAMVKRKMMKLLERH